MANVTMTAYKISDIKFINNVNSKVRLKMKTKVSHNATFLKNGTCEAALTVEVGDDEFPDSIRAKVTVRGIFEVNSEIQKELLHVETYKELFPFAKSLITTISALSGIPAIYPQNVDVEKKEIYRFDMSAAKGELPDV